MRGGGTGLVSFSSAFTLAEVLITLGVIGVVAALTLPNLIANYKEKVFVASAKKSYSTIMNAMNSWLAKNETPGDYSAFWFSKSNDNDLTLEFAKELNYAEICLGSDNERCGGYYNIRQYKKINDGYGETVSEDWISNFSRIVMTDGSFIVVHSDIVNGSCKKTSWANEQDEHGNFIPDPSSPTGFKGKEVSSDNCGRIAFDTNGLKGPNQIGIDVFEIPFRTHSLGYAKSLWGNIDYVLANDKLIETENYQTGKY